MAGLNTSYMGVPPTPVKDFTDFVGSGLPEIPKLKALVTAIKSVFKVQDVQLQLYFLEGRRYRVDVFTNKKKNVLVSSIYYVPDANQVHIYDNAGNILIASDKKKVIHSTIPFLIDFIGGADRLKVVLQAV